MFELSDADILEDDDFVTVVYENGSYHFQKDDNVLTVDSTPNDNDQIPTEIEKSLRRRGYAFKDDDQTTVDEQTTTDDKEYSIVVQVDDKPIEQLQHKLQKNGLEDLEDEAGYCGPIELTYAVKNGELVLSSVTDMGLDVDVS